MIYKAKKQVFNSKGQVVDTSFFDLPASFFEDLIKLLMFEGYTLFEHDDNYTMLSKVFTQNDQRFYSRFQFRKYRKVHG